MEELGGCVGLAQRTDPVLCCVFVRTGSLSFEGFLEFCDECWSDAELIRVAKAVGVELRYRFDSEQHRVLRVFQQNGVNEDGEQIHHRRRELLLALTAP